MITISPFTALRPAAQHAKTLASRPYDVLNRKEAKTEAQGNPASFLHITRSEIGLPESVDAHDELVYKTAKENLQAFISRELLFVENKACYYIYSLTMDGKEQTGLVCVSSLDDYENGLIKKHEFTRPVKEKDRIDHITATGAQTGNVFLAYRPVTEIDDIIATWKRDKNSQYDFEAEDGIKHAIWIINDDEIINRITELFKTKVPATYIADGHHRAASAYKVRQALGANATSTSDYFLTTIFPSNQLHILDYNRVIKDLNNHNTEEILDLLKKKFTVAPVAETFQPAKPHEFGFYVNKQWYRLEALDGSFAEDEIGILDISIFQENILTPIFNIADQRTSDRIDFVGGIRGLNALETMVDKGDFAAAFSFYPVGMEQLFAVADSGNVMPPKSTWFEPKLRDGLLTHLI